MANCSVIDPPEPGFCFENTNRNKHLADKLCSILPRATKTGTTICGMVFKDGVCLGADTRATNGEIVAEKNTSKIHYIADNMYCCGAGTAADLEKSTDMISSQIELNSLNTGRQSRVITAVRLMKQMLFQYQGQIGAAVIIGGVDFTGPHIVTVSPHGSTVTMPYHSMGSGSLAAMAQLETRYKKDLSKEEAMKIVRDAVAAGIFNDLGSGSNIDLCVITKDKTEYLRPYDVANIKGQSSISYKIKPGTTAVLTSKVKYEVSEEVVLPMEH